MDAKPFPVLAQTLSLEDGCQQDPFELEAFCLAAAPDGDEETTDSTSERQSHTETNAGRMTDEDFIAQFLGSSDKAARLWAGNIDGYASCSEADCALCVLLAMATSGDAVTIDRLFRRSRLYRAKWDERHGTKTYGAITIKHAIEFWRGCDTKPYKIAVKDVAEELCQTDHFAKGPGKALYYYEGGRFCPNGVEYVSRRVKGVLLRWRRATRWSSHFGREVAEYIRLTSPALWEQPPLDVVNLTNGLYDLARRALLPHTPNHRSPVQLPFPYAPNAKCPEWERFIEKVFLPDCQTLAYEIPAYLMRPDKSQQVAILLFGNGSNGKSRYLQGITNYLGLENVAALSLHRLETDRFAVARLEGKLANSCPDLPSQELASTSVFKSLVGGDTMLAERKFETSFEFVPYARLIFSANSYPRSKDASFAFFRRWLVIPFERSFQDAPDAIPPNVLDSRLKQSAELSGFFNRVLGVLPEFETRGSFLRAEATQRAGWEFQQQTDPIAVWLEAETFTSPSAQISKQDLYLRYSGQMRERDEVALTQKAFSQAVKRLRPQIREGQPVLNGQRVHAWIGLRLKTAADRARDARDARDAQG
jgi:putative DNA primase/helicase